MSAPSRVRDVLSEVETLLGVDIPCAYGPLEPGKNENPARVTWVLGSAQYRPTDRPGGNPRALWRRDVTVSAHIWGKNEGDAEDIAYRVVRALHDTLHGSYDMVGETWLTPDTAQFSHRGVLVGLEFVIHLVVPSAEQRTIVIQNAVLDPSGAVPGDGILSYGD